MDNIIVYLHNVHFTQVNMLALHLIIALDTQFIVPVNMSGDIIFDI